ncbi:MAG: hypothetical protein QXY59_04305 [Candidatus Korarchaeota archaeon]
MIHFGCNIPPFIKCAIIRTIRELKRDSEPKKKKNGYKQPPISSSSSPIFDVTKIVRGFGSGVSCIQNLKREVNELLLNLILDAK